jgi:hypothetical protein
VISGKKRGLAVFEGTANNTNVNERGSVSRLPFNSVAAKFSELTMRSIDSLYNQFAKPNQRVYLFH